MHCANIPLLLSSEQTCTVQIFHFCSVRSRRIAHNIRHGTSARGHDSIIFAALTCSKQLLCRCMRALCKYLTSAPSSEQADCA